MDAIVMLKEDHHAVERLFKQFEKTEPEAWDEKRSIVSQILLMLTQHAYIEEQIFYPAARRAVPETRDHVLESVEEHHVVAWMLSELSSLDPHDERFNAKMSVLIENVRHHVKEEEQEWFPQVRKAIGRKQLQELGAQLAAAKPQAPSDPLALSSAKN